MTGTSTAQEAKHVRLAKTNAGAPLTMDSVLSDVKVVLVKIDLDPTAEFSSDPSLNRDTICPSECQRSAPALDSLQWLRIKSYSTPPIVGTSAQSLEMALQHGSQDVQTKFP